MLNRKSNLYALLLIYMAVSMAGCAGQQYGMTPADELSPKEIAIWADRIYTAEYDAYVVSAESVSLNEDQRIYLRKKKRLLEELYPLLITYNAYIESGVLPEKQTTDLIMNLVYRLTGGI